MNITLLLSPPRSFPPEEPSSCCCFCFADRFLPGKQIKISPFSSFENKGTSSAKAGLKTDYKYYREILKEFIAKDPQREIYLAAGWVQNEEKD